MESGILSLTFDDALHEHLDNVIPALNAHGLVGTFYTHLAAPALLTRQTEWAQAAATGHELGNHTVFHPADARKSWVREGNAIDWYSLDRMRLELEFASQWLTAIDGRSVRTFAYPCSNPSIGHDGWVRRSLGACGLDHTRIAGWIDRGKLDLGSTKRSYEPIVAELFAAGRGGGLLPADSPPPIKAMKRSQLPSVAVTNWSLSQLQHFVSQSIANETWGILQFHGVGGGHHMDCSLIVFEQFVNWLSAEHRNRVTTVVNGASRIWPHS
ncbi:MAG: polysaccharide deacetylase family protein [Planctomycetes bacterium]|nr:polysaccharide deacetylase family protein [Planctomycetota bacterium]